MVNIHNFRIKKTVNVFCFTYMHVVYNSVITNLSKWQRNQILYTTYRLSTLYTKHMMVWNAKELLHFLCVLLGDCGLDIINLMQQQGLMPLCVHRPVRAPTASASTDAPTFRARWWSSAMTVIRCEIISTVMTSTPAMWWTATGPSTSTPITAGASTLWSLGSTASLVTGGPPVPLPGPSAESLIFKHFSFFQDVYWNRSCFKPSCTLWCTKEFALFDHNINVTLDSIKYIYCVMSRSLWVQNLASVSLTCSTCAIQTLKKK